MANRSSRPQNFNVFFLIFIVAILFLGLSLLIMWNRNRPGSEPTFVINRTPVPDVVTDGVDLTKYDIFFVPVEDDRVAVQALKNERMVLYEPDTKVIVVAENQLEPTPTPPLPTAVVEPREAQVTAVPIVIESAQANPTSTFTPFPSPTSTIIWSTPVPTAIVFNGSGNQTITFTYQVAQGDTMYGLACRNNSSISMLSSHVSAEDLVPGAVVTIVAPNTEFCPGNVPHEYAVREGDTLFSIGQSIGESPERIVQLNNGLGTISGSNGIRAGGVICLPAVLNRC